MTTTGEVEISLRFSKIELLKFEYSAQVAPIESPNFSVRLNNHVNSDTNTVEVIVNVLIHGDTKSEKYAECNTKISFELEDVGAILRKTSKEEAEILTGFLVMVNSISISTTRGILFSSLKGTALDKAILPIFDPKTFVNAVPAKSDDNE